MKANITRKSYYFNIYRLKKITRMVRLKEKPFKKKNLDEDRYLSLFCLVLPNNTFLTIMAQEKIKKHTITAGSSGFKGPKRSSPFSRHVVARNMSWYIFKNRIKEAFDLYFSSNVNRKFWFFFKGLITKVFVIRFLLKNKTASHGHFRPKKKRRK